MPSGERCLCWVSSPRFPVYDWIAFHRRKKFMGLSEINWFVVRSCTEITYNLEITWPWGNCTGWRYLHIIIITIIISSSRETSTANKRRVMEGREGGGWEGGGESTRQTNGKRAAVVCGTFHFWPLSRSQHLTPFTFFCFCFLFCYSFYVFCLYVQQYS